MKRVILYMILLIAAGACSTDQLETYDASRYIYFTNMSSRDSTTLSFFYYPGQDSVRVPLYLSYAGEKITRNCSYTLEVNPELTTAQPDSYFVESGYTWEAGNFTDTAFITLRKTALLDEKTVRLVVNVIGSNDFIAGPTRNLEYRIIYTSTVSQPKWWDSNVVKNYLGAYSEAKYTEFIIATDGITDLTGVGDGMLRYYALKLKYHLQKAKDAGKPIMDGQVEMTVPVLG